MITADFEMENQRFRTLPDIYSYDLFPPFKNSLQILWNSLTNVAESGIVKEEGNLDPGQFDESDYNRNEKGEFVKSSNSEDKRNKKEEKAQKKKEEKERKKQEEYEQRVAREYGSTGLSHFKRGEDTITVDAEIPIYKHPNKTRSVYTLLKGDVKVKDVFCGKGDSSGRPFKDASDIAKQYGGNPNDWGHAKGTATVRDDDGSVSVREVHWMEHPSIGQHDWKIKESN